MRGRVPARAAGESSAFSWPLWGFAALRDLPLLSCPPSRPPEEPPVKPLFLSLTLVLMTTLSASADDKPAAYARVFELRTYHAHPGKMAALNARFRDHTCKLFEKHGMTVIG